MNKFLYLPIETKSREFPGKLLLALYAAEEGFKVLIGNRLIMNKISYDLPNGIYFYNATMPHDVSNINRWREKGHKVVILDEEGLLFESEKIYLERRISQQGLADASLIFTWGNRQKDVIVNAFPDFKEKIFSVGNPRIDLLHKKVRGIIRNQTEEHIKKYGKFILINTNFGITNNYIGENYYREMYEKFGFFSDEKNELEFNKRIRKQKELFQEFKTMVIKLSKIYKDINFIIRPHPSESLEGWKDIEDNNVKIIREGNVHIWILASKLVIHNSCTTGLESYLLDKPVIAYTPNNLKEEGLDLPNQLSVELNNIDDIAIKIKEIIDKGSDKFFNEMINIKSQEILNYYIQTKKEELSCERIINKLVELNIELNEKISAKSYFKIKSYSKIDEFKYFITKLFNLNKSIKYFKSKFPSIDGKDFELIKMYKNELKIFREVSIKKISNDILLIEKE